MSDMTHERFDELKESYVLNAVSDEERRELEEYLALHPERQTELDDLYAVVGLLALSPDEHDPAPGVRKNLMAVVEAEARRNRSIPATPAGESLWDRISGYFRRRNLAFGAAAMLVLGLLSWNMLLQSEVQDLQSRVAENQNAVQQPAQQPTMVRLQGSGGMQDVRAELVRLEGGRTVLVADGLPPVEEDETYQIWVISGEEPRPSGLFRPGEEMVTVPVEGTLRGADAVAITVEPEGGSPAPTTDPMLSAKI
jgi:anti-sigma-K factor RskA